MTSSGPILVAVPALLLPVDAALVRMTAGELKPPRVDTAEPTAARVEACADSCEQMKPQFEATYLLKLLYKVPLLASQVRLELLRRDREKKVALWRKNSQDNRTAALKRKRAAAAAAAEEHKRNLRSRVAAADGQASGSSSSVAAAAGCRGPDLRPLVAAAVGQASSSSSSAAAAAGCRGPVDDTLDDFWDFVPAGKPAPDCDEEAGSAADADDGESDDE